MKYKILSFIILIIVSTPASSQCFSSNCQGIGSDVIVSVYPNQTGNIFLEGPVDRNALNCTLQEGRFMVLQPDHLLFREIYSTILTALSTQKELIVRIRELSKNCEVLYVRMKV